MFNRVLNTPPNFLIRTPVNNYFKHSIYVGDAKGDRISLKSFNFARRQNYRYVFKVTSFLTLQTFYTNQ